MIGVLTKGLGFGIAYFEFRIIFFESSLSLSLHRSLRFFIITTFWLYTDKFWRRKRSKFENWDESPLNNVSSYKTKLFRSVPSTESSIISARYLTNMS